MCRPMEVLRVVTVTVVPKVIPVKENSIADVSVVLAAANFAAAKHRGQFRKGIDGAAYINHPIAVADLLANVANITDPTTLAAALLHDTIEDTSTTADELLAAGFGDEVVTVVVEVTDDKDLPKVERKRLQIEHAPTISKRAKLVKLADKICNLRDIKRSPPDWPIERKREYFEWANKVAAGLRGQSVVLDGLFDAEYRQAP
jgi:guanosine-3',5'-bis(diphosphate) 3'-pyrophosphohydrolase